LPYLFSSRRSFQFLREFLSQPSLLQQNEPKYFAQSAILSKYELLCFEAASFVVFFEAATGYQPPKFRQDD